MDFESFEVSGEFEVMIGPNSRNVISASFVYN